MPIFEPSTIKEKSYQLRPACKCASLLCAFLKVSWGFAHGGFGDSCRPSGFTVCFPVPCSLFPTSRVFDWFRKRVCCNLRLPRLLLIFGLGVRAIVRHAGGCGALAFDSLAGSLGGFRGLLYFRRSLGLIRLWCL